MEPNQNPSGDAKKGLSPLAWVALVIVVVAIVGGAWLTMQKNTTTETTLPPITTAEKADAATVALSEQSSSDEVADIDTDLKATDFNAMEADMQAI